MNGDELPESGDQKLTRNVCHYNSCNSADFDWICFCTVKPEGTLRWNLESLFHKLKTFGELIKTFLWLHLGFSLAFYKVQTGRFLQTICCSFATTHTMFHCVLLWIPSRQSCFIKTMGIWLQSPGAWPNSQQHYIRRNLDKVYFQKKQRCGRGQYCNKLNNNRTLTIKLSRQLCSDLKCY